MMTLTRGNDLSPMHIGTTLALAHFYHGDGVSSDGCYYWNEEKGEIGCCMADDMFRPEVVIDASPEMQEKAQRWVREKVKEYIPDFVEGHNRDLVGVINKGDTVRVVKGRKVPKGTVGKVFWKGETRFGVSVGIALSDRKDPNGKYADVAFTSPGNLDVVNPQTYTLTEAQAEAICDKYGTVRYYDRLRATVEGAVKRELGIHPNQY